MQSFRHFNVFPPLRQSKALWLTSVCLGVALVVCVKKSSAQSSSTENYWQQIQRADAQIQTSQLTWKRVVDEAPNPVWSKNPREALARQLERAKANAQERGLTRAQTQIVLQATRDIVEERAKGSSQTQLLKVLHNDKSTRCDVVALDGTYFSIDFFDGLNCVSLFEFYLEKQNDKIAPGARPDAGTLSRDLKDRLSYSAPRTGDFLFFVSGRITSAFSPTNCVLRDVSAQSLELERPQSSDPRSPLLRLVISKKSLRPQRLDYVGRESGKTLLRYQVESYRDFPGVNQFPSQINFTAYGGDGVYIMVSKKCTLLKAAFNGAADLTELRVPPGTDLDDYRFGQQYSASYTLGPKGTLPPDEKVRALLEEQGRSPQNVSEKSNAAPVNGDLTQTSTNSPTPTNTNSAATLVLGGLLVLSGCLLWVRAGSDKSKRS